MKNIIAAAMALAMLLSFSACGRKNNNNNASPDELPDAGTTVPATTVPTHNASPSPSPTATAQQPENTVGIEKTDVSPEDIWNAIYDKYGDTFPVTDAVPAESLLELTGIDPEKLESFIFQFPMMNVSASEFFIAKCREGQLEDVKEEVMAHQAALAEQWKQYLPEQLKLVENYVMETSDNYIFFAVAENAEGAAEIFKGYFE